MSGTSPRRPGPVPTPESAPFWEGLAAGAVRFQRCARCGHAQNYPRARCTSCWGADLRWEDASGAGSVWTWTVVHRPSHPAWQTEAPYAVVVVELAEGPRLTSRYRGDLERLTVGLPVTVGAMEQDGYHVVVVEP